MGEAFRIVKTFGPDEDPIVVDIAPGASDAKREVLHLSIGVRSSVQFTLFLLHTDHSVPDVLGDVIWSLTDPKLPQEVIASCASVFNGRSYQAKIVSKPSTSLRISPDHHLFVVVAFSQPPDDSTVVHIEGLVSSNWSPKRTKLNAAGPWVVSDGGSARDGRSFSGNVLLGNAAPTAESSKRTVTSTAKPRQTATKKSTASKKKSSGFRKVAKKKLIKKKKSTKSPAKKTTKAKKPSAKKASKKTTKKSTSKKASQRVTVPGAPGLGGFQLGL